MNRNLFLVAASLFTWGLGEGFFIYFQPLYLQEWGADPVMIGTILGGVGIALALAQTPTGLLSDKFSPKTLMLVSWFIGLIFAWVMTLARSLPVFVIGMLCYNLSGFGIIPMNVYCTNVRGKLSVQRALTFSSGLYNLGSVIGPIIGGKIADSFGLRSVYLIASIIFFLSVGILFFIEDIKQAPHADMTVHPHQVSIFKNPRLLGFFGVLFITLFLMYLPQPLTPSFLQNQQHFSRATIGLLGACGSFGNALVQIALGSVSPYLGLLIGQFMVALFAGAFLMGGSAAWFGLSYAFVGGYRLFRSMILAFTRPLVHVGETGLIYGLLETIAMVSIVLAPMVSGLLYDQSPTLVYKVSFLSILVMLALNVFILKKIETVPAAVPEE
ncbi:MAG: MFS transporter [Anaerolineaceae bacterium]|nr:MFS transporter [Anaerolineaceae bacterium]